jgi:hypothetical protein
LLTLVNSINQQFADFSRGEDMGKSDYARAALYGAAVCAFLSGCASSQSAVNPTVGARPLTLQSMTFNYTGGNQTFTVPSGVKKITITANGASGGAGYGFFSEYSAPGGLGGRTKATIPVHSGETLTVVVGGNGADGGFNGGGLGEAYGSDETFGTGGGASDVREGGDKLRDRVVIGAGGGGGGGAGSCLFTTCGYVEGGPGGDGGGLEGQSGASGPGPSGGTGGAGGTQSAGGAGGAGAFHCHGGRGKKGLGGAAAAPCRGGFGGGGGGGYYGGGAGGGGKVHGTSTSLYGGAGGGGGGGSSFAEATATHVHLGTVTSYGNGVIVISW